MSRSRKSSWVFSPSVPRWRPDLLFLFGIYLLWWSLFELRRLFIQHPCMKTPDLCDASKVNALDRFAIGQVSEFYDFLSFVTQDVSGALALLIPIGIYLYWTLKGRLSGQKLFNYSVGDTILLLQATALNGVINEIVRGLVRRPRPFVYLDPTGQSGNPAHYTSFYSGHTSFAALATLMLTLTLAGRGVRTTWLWASLFLLCLPLTVSTGVFRVLSGRHFWTDVIAGAIAGFLVAVFIQRIHRGKVRPHG